MDHPIIIIFIILAYISIGIILAYLYTIYSKNSKIDIVELGDNVLILPIDDERPKYLHFLRENSIGTVEKIYEDFTYLIEGIEDETGETMLQILNKDQFKLMK